MKKLNIATLLCGLILFFTACGGSTTATSVDEVETTAKSVAEGEVAIGNQVWTSKNLDVAKYRNGDSIPEVKDKSAWKKLKKGAWCYYENKAENGTKYGKLYNWFAVNDPRGLAPTGYHIPTDAEWTMLTDYLGGDSIAGTKMKSRSGWQNNGNGTNSSGFNALPGGWRLGSGDLYSIGAEGFWWSSSENDTNSVWFRYLDERRGDVYKYYFYKQKTNDGLSVRCIKD